MLQLEPSPSVPENFDCQPVEIGNVTLRADRSGALYWPAEKALIVADLHLEKGSSRAARGLFLPPYDTRTTLARLAAAIARYDVEVVIALGDSLHDTGAFDRIADDDLDALGQLQAGRDWIWVTGNHDPEIDDRLGGRVVGDIVIAGLTLRHAPDAGDAGREIAGHLHPAAKLAVHGHTVRRPCFVGNARRLVVPAFGAFTGGLNVLDLAFQPLLGDGPFRVWMLGRAGIYPVAPRQLRTD